MRMLVNTKRFGQVEIEDKQIITFIKPILGFEDSMHYFLLNPEENKSPFEFLQSKEDENLTFIVTDPFVFFNDYEFQLTPHWLEALNIESDQDVSVMVIVTVRSTSEITCNLKAPIILNKSNRHAAQIILDQGDYSTSQALIVNERGADANADPFQK